MFGTAGINAYMTVCQYIVGASFVGQLDHCYNFTLSVGFLTYTRNYCVYTGISVDGTDYSGTMEIPYEQANQC